METSDPRRRTDTRRRQCLISDATVPASRSGAERKGVRQDLARPRSDVETGGRPLEAMKLAGSAIGQSAEGEAYVGYLARLATERR